MEAGSGFNTTSGVEIQAGDCSYHLVSKNISFHIDNKLKTLERLVDLMEPVLGSIMEI